MPRIPRFALLLALFGLIVAGCSDDGGSDGGDDGTTTTEEAAGLTDEEQAFADAYALSFTDEGGGAVFAVDESECMAEAFIAEVGTGPFDEAGLTPEDVDAAVEDGDASPGDLLGAGVISEDQANAVLDEWEDCADLEAVFLENMGSVIGEITDEQRDCATDALRDEGLVRDGFVHSMVAEGDPSNDLIQQIIDAVEGCGVDVSDGGNSDGDTADGGTDDGGTDDEDGTDGEVTFPEDPEDLDGPMLVSLLATGMMQSGELDRDQAECLAQAVMDAIGEDELVAAARSGESFDNLPPEMQQQMVGAIEDEAERCGVPPELLAN